MSNPNPQLGNLKPFTGADDPRRVNGAPKGTKHIATWIKDMLNDEEFETLLTHPIKGYVEFKGAPLKAIIETAIKRAIAGDYRWADWLAKHGYGTKIIHDVDEDAPLALVRFVDAPTKDSTD